MVLLKVILSPEACGRVYDALSCLAKFSDSVTVEAQAAQLMLSALNSSKSAYVCMTLEKSFFSSYSFISSGGRQPEKFSCQMLNRALSSVFKGRVVDPRQRESALDRCEVSLHEDADTAKCRFNVKMICVHGITKTYRLTYEGLESMRALFDKERATNNWKISAVHLREYIEYFAKKTEQLDIYPADGRCNFISFTEKITHGKAVLKQPLQTAVSIEIEDFQEFNVIDNLHIIISVKDFKTMVIHAETLKTSVTALYSQAARPLQFSYTADSMKCEFTLMTIGDAQPPTSMASKAPIRQVTTRPIPSFNRQINSEQRNEMREPQTSASAEQGRALGRRISSDNQRATTEDDQGLFVTDDDDDDRQWAPLDEQKDDTEMLGWDASGDNDCAFRGTFRDGGSTTRQLRDNAFEDREVLPSHVAPTQKASQIRGIFD